MTKIGVPIDQSVDTRIAYYLGHRRVWRQRGRLYSDSNFGSRTSVPIYRSDLEAAMHSLSRVTGRNVTVKCRPGLDPRRWTAKLGAESATAQTGSGAVWILIEALSERWLRHLKRNERWNEIEAEMRGGCS
jgi:hypothetical protein